MLKGWRSVRNVEVGEVYVTLLPSLGSVSGLLRTGTSTVLVETEVLANLTGAVRGIFYKVLKIKYLVFIKKSHHDHQLVT